jgi:hypothetical protein
VELIYTIFDARYYLVMARPQTEGAREMKVFRSYSHSSGDTLDSAVRTENQRIKSNVRMLCSRVQTMLRPRGRKQKRSLEIVSE